MVFIDRKDGYRKAAEMDENPGEMSIRGPMTRFDLSVARLDLEHIVDEVLSGEAAEITTDHGSVVLLSSEDYEGLLETLYLMSDPDFEKDVADAKALTLEKREAWNRHHPDSGQDQIAWLNLIVDGGKGEQRPLGRGASLPPMEQALGSAVCVHASSEPRP